MRAGKTADDFPTHPYHLFADMDGGIELSQFATTRKPKTKKEREIEKITKWKLRTIQKQCDKPT